MKPFIIWFNGLSGSGKTTLANKLFKLISKYKLKAKIIDGDLIRSGINKDLGFSMADRKENIRRAAEISNLFLDEGFIVIACFITPLEEMREMVRQIIDSQKLVEIYLNTPIEVCKIRDPKGLYKDYELGKIKGLSGIDSLFEPNQKYDIIIDTSKNSIQNSIKLIEKQITIKLS